MMALYAHQIYVLDFLQQQQLTKWTIILVLHDTGISLIQHPSHVLKGYNHDVLVIINQTPSSSSHSTATLPMKYTSVPPASIKSKEFIASKVNGCIRPTAFQMFTVAKVGELKWLQTVITALKNEELDKMDLKSWFAYHASRQ